MKIKLIFTVVMAYLCLTVIMGCAPSSNEADTACININDGNPYVDYYNRYMDDVSFCTAKGSKESTLSEQEQQKIADNCLADFGWSTHAQFLQYRQECNSSVDNLVNYWEQHTLCLFAKGWVLSPSLFMSIIQNSTIPQNKDTL